MISGGRLDNFRKGWALYIWGTGHKKVHYWTRESIEEVSSTCGITRHALWDTPGGQRHSTMYAAGDFPLCGRCKGW